MAISILPDVEMRARKRRWVGLLVGVLLGLQAGPAWAVFLDQDESLRFSGRVYNRTAFSVERAAENTRLQTPYNDWNMLQNRTFIQGELSHDLTGLVAGNATGLLAPLQALLAPLRLLRADTLDYFVTYRGEYDGVWDYGPAVFRERYPLFADCGEPTKAKHSHPRRFGCRHGDPRQRLRHRHRLFEAYVNYAYGPFFLRVGRQNLSWGETDVFRLLDQINPLDAGFGGFLVSLDERRVPLDMARVVYGFGGVGPLSELNLEGFLVFDDKIAAPVPTGSPWSTPNPPGVTGQVKKPSKNFADARGGGRIVGVWGEVMFSLAHYATYLDTPVLRIVTPTKRPVSLGAFEAAVQAGDTGRFLTDHFQAKALYPKIQISGGSLTFGVPRISSILRSEFAYFHSEPFFHNSASDQLLGPALTGTLTPGYQQVGTDPDTGRPLMRYRNKISRSDVVRWSVGLDMTRYISLLNPNESFLISSQIFGRHILDFNDTPVSAVSGSYGFGHFAAPIYEPNRDNNSFVNIDQHQLIQTLLISTAYFSGRVEPKLIFLYDWQGSWLVQPEITFIRDPFRLSVQYNYLDGQYNGIGFLRDRDNVIIQLEAVI